MRRLVAKQKLRTK